METQNEYQLRADIQPRAENEKERRSKRRKEQPASCPPRAYLYRIGTEESVGTLLDASAQRDWVTENDGIVVGEWQDASPRGNVFFDMLSQTKKDGCDTILISRLLEVFPEGEDTANTFRVALARDGVSLRAIDAPDFGKSDESDAAFSAQVTSAMQLIKSVRGAQLRRGIVRATAARGHLNGAPPYGYRYASDGSGNWEVDEVKAEYVRRLFDYWINQAPTLVAATRYMNEIGAETPAKGTAKEGAGFWSTIVVRRTLVRRAYIGEVPVEGGPIKASFPAIISREVFEKAGQRLERRGKGNKDGGSELFAGGVLRCPICRKHGRDTFLAAGASRQKNRQGVYYEPYYNYACSYRRDALKRACVGMPFEPGIWVCPGFQISEKRIVKLIFDALSGLVSVGIPPPPEDKETQTAREAELSTVSEKRMRAQELYVNGEATSEELNAILMSIELRRQALLQAAETARQQAQNRGVTPSQAETLLTVLADESIPLLRRRDLLRERIAAIIPAEDRSSVDIILA